jgi:hypothetical protein
LGVGWEGARVALGVSCCLEVGLSRWVGFGSAVWLV